MRSFGRVTAARRWRLGEGYAAVTLATAVAAPEGGSRSIGSAALRGPSPTDGAILGEARKPLAEERTTITPSPGPHRLRPAADSAARHKSPGCVLSQPYFRTVKGDLIVRPMAPIITG